MQDVMITIESVKALELLDSRGWPTLEVHVTAALPGAPSVEGRAMVPSGMSKGVQEALERRDGDPKRFGGKGVLRAVCHVEQTIASCVVGQAYASQAGLDAALCALDPSPQKAHVGANAVLGVSLAFARAASLCLGQPLAAWCQRPEQSWRFPTPLVNVINGGMHADNDLDIQEFLIIPKGAAHIQEAMLYVFEITSALRARLQQKGWGTGVGDEGGFAPRVSSTRAVLDVIGQAVEDTGLVWGEAVALGLDMAASTLYRDQHYQLEGARRLSRDAWIQTVWDLVRDHPVISLEDPMAEQDWEGWQAITAALGHQVQLVGDDVFVSRCELVARGIREHAGNAVLIKPNQVGTLTEAQDTITAAQQAGWGVVVSHRSGDTEDAFIADLALGCGAGQIKAGALCRGERTAKYNALLRHRSAWPQVPYAGAEPFVRFAEPL